VCRTGLNNAESLLNKKENTLIKCQESLNQEKILNTNLTQKYDTLLTQYETEKENYQHTSSILNEKVRIIIYIYVHFFSCYLLLMYINLTRFEDYK